MKRLPIVMLLLLPLGLTAVDKDSLIGKWMINTVRVKDVLIYSRNNPEIQIRAAYEMRRLRKGRLTAKDSASISRRLRPGNDRYARTTFQFTPDDSLFTFEGNERTMYNVSQIAVYALRGNTAYIRIPRDLGVKRILGRETAGFYFRNGKLYQTVMLTITDDDGTRFTEKAEFELIKKPD